MILNENALLKIDRLIEEIDRSNQPWLDKAHLNHPNPKIASMVAQNRKNHADYVRGFRRRSQEYENKADELRFMGPINKTRAKAIDKYDKLKNINDNVARATLISGGRLGVEKSQYGGTNHLFGPELHNNTLSYEEKEKRMSDTQGTPLTKRRVVQVTDPKFKAQ